MEVVVYLLYLSSLCICGSWQGADPHRLTSCAEDWRGGAWVIANRTFYAYSSRQLLCLRIPSLGSTEYPPGSLGCCSKTSDYVDWANI
jgi:hypothetical protein